MAQLSNPALLVEEAMQYAESHSTTTGGHLGYGYYALKPSPARCEVVAPEVRYLDQFGTDPAETIAKTLLGIRYLCRAGGMLFVGPTGIGKSSWIMQGCIRWALGQTHFGIKPSKPLRILIIQAENDDGDVAEMRDGVFRGLGLSEAEKQAACEMIQVVCESSATGDQFVALVAKLASAHKPDLIIIDPLFAYIGGPVDQVTCSHFLRNGLNPVLKAHDCGLILIHHANKPPQGREKADWQAGDFAYYGSGSAELANWSRAGVALRSIGSHDVFELVLGKRGKRAGIVDEAGQPVFKMTVKHSKTGICWEPATEDEELIAPGKKAGATLEDALRLIPTTGSISQAKLFNAASAAGIGENRLRKLLAELREDGKVHIWESPRPRTRAALAYSRYKQGVADHV